MNKLIMLFLGIVLIGVLMLALRSTVLKTAYDLESPTTLTLTNGTSVSVAGSPISGATSATIYNLVASAIVLVGIVGALAVGFRTLRSGN